MRLATAAPDAWSGLSTYRSAETIILRGTRSEKPGTSFRDAKARAAPATPAYMHTAYFQIEAVCYVANTLACP